MKNVTENFDLSGLEFIFGERKAEMPSLNYTYTERE